MFIKGFFSNSVGILISRIFGLMRDLLTATVLGAGVFSDIFFIAFKIPNLFRRIFGEGAFTQAFLPNFTKTAKKAVFSADIFLKFLLFIGILTLLINLFTPQFIRIIASGLDDTAIANATPLVQINFYYLALIYIVTFLGSLLQYRGHFATTAFSTALLNLAMILALLLARGKDEQTVAYYLSFGVVMGGILQVLAHIIALKFNNLNRLFYGGLNGYIKGKRTNLKGFFTNFYHGLLGSSAMQISAFIDTWLASFLVSGSISYMFYANRISQLPLAIFAIALSQALFPKITRLLKANDEVNALVWTKKSFYILLTALLGATAGGIILAEPIIWLLFERGNFDRADTLECAKVLIAYMIGLVPFGLAKIFSLWLYAKMQQKMAARISLICLGINLILAIILMQPFGASGLALASSLGGFLQLVLYIKAFGFGRFLGIIEAKKFIIITFALAILCGILIYLKDILYANL
ncbi:murein biosynthesis integral membrane protein MurJ [Campylobacter sp. faydin G-140]|uniref:murein biosynthesis integral membrane protein MurJ n=1 Tax=Campylobacter anatolicus TaxID=2829105 RepID=UPI001B9BB8C3|nr:murein biosynthesis integral membrane protein MurJ [Campylobacter anatolicus]MBR8465855.1 murein biosynthesis integral membrane protein MurJ [Campylobacter anatolicus]